MPAFIYSKRSHRKIVHIRGCRILNRIPREERVLFRTLQEAQENGYRLCRCCSPVLRRYRKDRKEIEAFISKHRYSMKENDGNLLIRSAKDTWRIIVHPITGKVVLLHKNLYGDPGQESPGWLSGFHFIVLTAPWRQKPRCCFSARIISAFTSF